MTKIESALRSKTFWTIVLIVLVNALPQIKTYLTPGTADLLNSVLGALATYFHVSTTTPTQA